MKFRIHIGALITSALLWAYVASIIMCNITGTKVGLDCSVERKQECNQICINTPEQCPSDCPKIMSNFAHHICDNSCFGPWFLPIVICLPYIIECFISKTLKYLRNGRNLINYEEFLTHSKASPPSIQLKIECGDIENSSTQAEDPYEAISKQTESPIKPRPSTSRAEDASPLTQKTRGSKGAYKRIEIFPISRWDDMVIEPEMPQNSLVMLRVKKKYEFANEYSKKYYDNQFNNLVRQHLFDGEGVKSEEMFDIQNYKEFVMVKKGDAQRPLCLNVWAYMAFSMIGLTWIFRMWANRHVVEREITVIKKVEVNEFTF